VVPDLTATPPPNPTTYRAIAEWDGHRWRVRIEGVGGLAGVQARHLADVGPRVRKLIWSYTGKHPADIELDVDLRLPPAIQLRLDLAEQLCEEATVEVEAAIDELLEARVSVADVGRVLRTRRRTERLLGHDGPSVRDRCDEDLQAVVTGRIRTAGCA
jgi:hypothetical protein